MYFPLHSQEIRLVDIHPGSFASPIHCTLRHASVSTNPPYKALSYVWGAAKATRRSITVDGHPHLVTVNLEFALRRIRQPDVVTTFWIDALSINQEDNEERSIQVGMMRNIYARAREVVIYLGEAPHHEFAGGPSKSRYPSALSVFYGDERDEKEIGRFQNHCLPKDSEKTTNSKKKLNYAHEVLCLISLLAQTSKLEDVPPFNAESQPFLDSFYQRNIFEALRFLMRSSWWNRIWVVQEVVVPKNIILIYDTTTTYWEMFVKAAQSYTKNSFSPAMSSFPREYSDVLSFFSRIALDIYHLRCRWENVETTTLLSLLRQFSNRKASDDRDKVYALLGLVTERAASDAPIIEPNYSLDTITVFKNTVLGIIESTGSLSILTGDLGRKNRQDLPSWAVDWSATSGEIDRRRAEDTENYNASGGVTIKSQRYNDTPFSGVSRYLGALETEIASRGMTVPPITSLREKYTRLLESSEWERYCVTPGTQRTEMECLQAIEHYLTIHKGLVWMRDLDNVLDCPGLYKGEVVMVGKPSFSNDDLEYLVRAWGSTVTFYHENINKSNTPVRNQDESFVRALCADMAHPESHISGSKPRRATKGELSEIKSWILRLGGLPGFLGALSHERALNHPSSEDGQKLSACMLASIRTATFRRRLFITNTGFIGIGPAGLQKGDRLYLLLGGKAPFILRESRHRKIPIIVNQPQLGSMERSCFEIIGDCFVHGLMDGEGMEGWKEEATKSFEHSKAQMDISLHDFEQWRAIQEQVVQGREVVTIMKRPEFGNWLEKARGAAEIGYWLEKARRAAEKVVGSELANVPSEPSTKKSGYRIEYIEDAVRKWLEKHELLGWVRNLDLRDSMKMVEDIVKVLEQDLKLAKEKLDNAAVELYQLELGSEDKTRVFLV